MKLVKKMPSWLGNKLNGVRVRVKPEVKLEKLEKFTDWFKELEN